MSVWDWLLPSAPGPTGWIDRPDQVEEVLSTLPMPLVGDAMDAIRGTGAGQVAPLHLALAKVRPGGYPVLEQAIGDCVSFGYAGATMLLAAVQIALQGSNEEWHGDVATEPIYGGSRVEIGGGGLWGDGSVGAWAAKWVSQYGILYRQRYGSEDLTTYSGARAKQYGRRGCPDDLEPIAREHPVKTVSLVTSYEEARDLIYNGCPVAVCSNQGFDNKRDADGFARPKGRWPHCMYFSAMDDSHRRPGLLCQNSWPPDWISGPKRLNQPDGSFWVEAEVTDRMFRARDSFGLSGYVGFPRRSFDWDLLWRGN